jgi:dethiobiotin synthetase
MSLSLDLPKVKGLFVTGTDTGVGKTLIAGGIANVLRFNGKKVGVFKPVGSGCTHQHEGLINSDAEFLRTCSHCNFSLSEINPVGFVTPAAPLVCEEFENRAVDFDKIVEAYKKICADSEYVIVEGVGGVRVPISVNIDVLDLAKEFQMPVLIVTRPDLGTINHTLLTIDAVKAAGLEIAGVVINGYDIESAGLAQESLAGVIEELGDVDIISVVPRDEESNVEENRLGADVVEELGEIDWEEICG